MPYRVGYRHILSRYFLVKVSSSQMILSCVKHHKNLLEQCTYTRDNIYFSTHIYIQIQKYTHIHLHTQPTYTNKYTHVCTYTKTVCIHIHIHSDTHSNIFRYEKTFCTMPEGNSVFHDTNYIKFICQNQGANIVLVICPE